MCAASLIARAYSLPCFPRSLAPLLLLGGAISVQHGEGTLTVGDWLTLKAPAQTAVLFKELRRAASRALSESIATPLYGDGSAAEGEGARRNKELV